MATSCNWLTCANGPRRVTTNEIPLSKCSRCKAVSYCSKACQKKDWGHHKPKCTALDVPRHDVEDFTIESIQRTINNANPGDVVLLKEGTYDGSGDLVVNKPIKLWGAKKDNVKLTTLNCNLSIRPSGLGNDSSGDIVLVDLTLNGIGKIDENMYKSITLSTVCLKSPDKSDRPDNTLTINECNGKCLILGSEIYGGGDGIEIRSEKVHIKFTDIRFCKYRGIFSRKIFTIEDCEVSNCGGYGIKGSAGWIEKGTGNDIQPGPWNPLGPSMSPNPGW